MPTQAQPEPVDMLELERDKLINWRLDQLLEAGYPLRTAKRLAEHPNVDLHLARQLLKNGATVRQAIHILL
jgi:hypothetical protein